MPSQSDFSSDSAFRQAVNHTLRLLMDQIDELDFDGIEPRSTPGSLMVTFEDTGDVFMLSQQTPTHELWLSANHTAWHFKHPEGAWIERDTLEPMQAVLSQLFTDKLGEPVRLTLPEQDR